MARKLPDNLAAEMLVECATTASSDARAAEKYGLTSVTVGNYRDRLNHDVGFNELFQSKLAEVQSPWAQNLAACINDSILFLQRACQVADPSDAETINAVNNTLKCLAEIAMTKEFLDRRIADGLQ